jgi:hypothetical protein
MRAISAALQSLDPAGAVATEIECDAADLAAGRAEAIRARNLCAENDAVVEVDGMTTFVSLTARECVTHRRLPRVALEGAGGDG